MVGIAGLMILLVVRSSSCGPPTCSETAAQEPQYASSEKARTMLGFAPAFEPEAAVLDGIRWLIDHDRLKVANRLIV